ncbi:hypothetical protein [Neobacillus sp. DY30]|uniref:hypothetical protein n=1 Tax=Neobacillus sp. DY30 TaxID=3047871 RepID=UPI0024C0489E|nr:hypothetical protein [Neobacillus sp. DY30]WHY01206.1 hypothetical protein QNH29_02790 [Neobacillus sp. DY30]
MEFKSYWYLGLGILSILLLAYVYLKTRDPRNFLLFLAMVGLGYIIETVIYNFGHSYHYYPKLIRHDTFYDSNMGAMASNALALPVAATFLAALRKNWLWILFFICFFAGTEWLFLKLGIYKHNWWKITYTALGLFFVYFPLAKLFYTLLWQSIQGKLHSILLFLIISPISASFQFTPIMFFSNRYYELGLFNTLSEDTTAFGSIYYMAVCLFYVWIAKYPWKLNWFKYVVTACLTFIVNLILQKAGILHSKVWWDPWYYVILSVFVLRFTVYISKHLTNGPQKMPDP